MDERLMQFRVGVMVLATFIITAILIVLFGEMPSLSRGNYQVRMHFLEAPGVTRDTPIRKSGILIGRVTDVNFDEERGGVLISAQIDGNRSIYQSEVPRISGTILGDATIEFVRGRGKPETKELISASELLEGEVSPSPVEAIAELQGRMNRAFEILEKTAINVDETTAAIRETSSAFTATGKEWTQVGARVNKLLSGDNEDEARGVLKKAESAIEQVEKTFANIDGGVTEIRSIIGDEQMQGNLQKSLAEFPRTLETARITLASLQEALATANRNLMNVEALTKSLGERGPELVELLRGAGENLTVVLANVGTFTKGLNNPDGSVAQFLNDPDFYMSINSAAARIDLLLRDVKPILDDVRVITDKFARHPNDIGLRGVLKKETGLK